jgi:cytochrome c-type biogenesis protein CcmH
MRAGIGVSTERSGRAARRNPQHRARRVRVGGLLVALLIATPAVSAQESPAVGTDSGGRPVSEAERVTRANKLIGGIMSPFCPGLTLANCPSVYADTLRVSVRARVLAGESPDSIVESLVAAFGEGIRGAPRARGFGLALWAMPLVALGLGGIGVIWWLRVRGVQARPALVTDGPDGGAPAPTPAELAGLEDVMRRFP